MINLFMEKREGRLLDFLNRHKGRVSLLAAPKFISQLHYAERRLESKNGFDFSATAITIDSLRKLGEPVQDETREPVYIVADPDDESARIAQMEQHFPHRTFRGLARDLVPALIAQNGKAIFEDIPQELQAERLTILLATPRSGSSLVADVLTDLGAGNTREHLRPDLIEALKSNYQFDRPAALRNFLNFAARNGHVGTKLITHFISEYINDVGDLETPMSVCAGMKIDVISIDRKDKVAQTISGHLASHRGIWHITADQDKKGIAEKSDIPLNFPSSLARYFSYCQQSCILKSYENLFPAPTRLEYAEDVLKIGLEELSAKLAAILQVEAPPSLLKSTSRERVRNDENDRLEQEFCTTYEASFGSSPERGLAQGS